MLNYKPSRPKELETLFSYLKMTNAPNSDQISVEKLVLTIRKVDPQYGALIISTNKS